MHNDVEGNTHIEWHTVLASGLCSVQGQPQTGRAAKASVPASPNAVMVAKILLTAKLTAQLASCGVLALETDTIEAPA